MLFPPRAFSRWLMFITLSFVLPATAQTAPERISVTPRTSVSAPSLALVIDNSRPSRYQLDDLKRTVSQFVKAYDSAGEMCVFTAGNKPFLLQQLTEEPDQVTKQLKKVRSAGPLALYDTVRAAADYLRGESVNDKLAIVVFAAAQQLEPPPGDLQSFLGNEPRVQVNAIVTPGKNWQAQEPFQRLVAATSGVALFPPKTSQLLEAAKMTGERLAGGAATLTAYSQQGKSSKSKPLAPYSLIIVRDVPVADGRGTAQFQGGDDVLLHKLLVSRLQKAKLFTDVVDGSGSEPPAKPVDPSGKGGSRLELLATVTEYQTGDRAKRAFLGWGGAKMKVKVLVRDASTLQPLLAFQEDGSASYGLFGGDNDQIQLRAVNRVAKGIVDRLKAAK